MIALLKRLFIEEESGATALEFALVLPVVAYFLFGIVDVGLLMFTSEELDATAEISMREVRTGALQAAFTDLPTGSGTSTYAGAANCINANFTLTTTSTNCLGITITSSDTYQSLLSKLLCANVLDGGTLLKCASINFNVLGVANWSDFTGVSELQPLSYTGSTPNPSFSSTYGGEQTIIAAEIGYRYYFFTPLIGCIFDPSDCAKGQKPYLLVTDYSVFQTEPFTGISS